MTISQILFFSLSAYAPNDFQPNLGHALPLICNIIRVDQIHRIVFNPIHPLATTEENEAMFIVKTMCHKSVLDVTAQLIRLAYHFI